MAHWSKMNPETYRKSKQPKKESHWSDMRPGEYRKHTTQIVDTGKAKQIVSTKPKPSPAPSLLSRVGKGIETGIRKFNAFSDAILDPFMEGRTLGLSRLAQKGGSLAADKIKQLFGETPAEREARHKRIAQKEAQKAISPTTRKVLGTVGDVAGVIGGLGTAQGIAKATIGKGLTKLGAKGLAKRAGTEAATGAIFEGSRALTEGKPFSETAKETGKGALLFGVAGPLGELAGAGIRRALPGAVGHYAGNIAKGGVMGTGFSVGENVLSGEDIEKSEAAKNAAAFAALELLTGGRYKPDFSKSYDMLGEVNRAYTRGKAAGVQLDTPFQVGRVTFNPQERQVIDILEKTGQSLDDLEKTAKKRYNKATPEEKKKLEESLNAIQQIRQKMARTPQTDRGRTAQTGSEPLQGTGDTLPLGEKIAVNQERAEAVPPLTPKLPKQTKLTLAPRLPKQPKETPPLDPATAKERRFVSNSALNAEVVPETMKQELRGNIPQYNPISNKETWDKATQKVTTNLDQAKEEWRAIESLASADDTALGEALIVDAIKRGDIAEANSLTADLAEKLTTAGQAVQAAAIFKRLTPEGMLLYAQRVINKAKQVAGTKTAQAEKMAADVEQKLASINNEVADKVAKDVVENAEKIINKAEEIKNLAPEEKLARKISGAISTRSKKQNLEQEMVNTLFRIASKYLPPKPKKNPLEPVVLALKDKNKYQEVWQKAKEILRKKYANDPEKLEILEDYLEKKLRPVFEQGKLNTAINLALKEMNVSLAKIVKEHFTVGNKVRDRLVDRLVKEAGLSGEEATTLENYIRNRMKELTKAKKEAVLQQMFKPRTPVEKTMIDRLIEYSNLGAFQNSNYRDLVAQKLGIPHLDEETAKFISRQMQKIQTMPEGRAKDVELAKVMQVIANKIPPALAKKISTFQTIAMLANPKTMLRNLGGNVLFAGAENISQTLGAGLDKGISLLTGKRTTLLPSLKTQFKGGLRGTKEAVQDYRLGIDTSPSRTQYDLPDQQVFKGALGKVERLTKLGLQLGDRPFWQAAYDDALRQQMKIAGVKQPTAEMMLKAEELANYRTYQDINKVTKLFQGIKKAFNKVGTDDFGLGDLVIKFPKTPANILARAIDYSPAQIINVVRSFTRNGFDQKKFVDAVSRGMTGTGAIILGYFLAKNGVITGKKNKNENLAALEEMSGIGQYSFNTDALKRMAQGKGMGLQEGDTFTTYDWAQPISIPLAIGADLFLSGKGEREATTVALDALKSGGETLFKQSLLQGLQRFMGGYSPVENIGETIANAPSGFIPTISKQFAQLADPIKRDVYNPDAVQTGVNLIKSRIPGITGNLQPKIDTLGNDVLLYQGQNTPFNVFLNPGFTTKYKPLPETKIIMDTFKQTGNTDILPKVLDRYIMVDGKRIDLTPQEYTDYQRIVGTIIRQEIGKLSPDLSPEERADAIAKIVLQAGKVGRNYLREQRGLPYLQR